MKGKDIGKKIKENLDSSKKEADEAYKTIVEEELMLVKKFTSESIMDESSLPPINIEDEYGNIMPHKLISGKYIPTPLADVKIQEKAVIAEYNELQKIKEEAKIYVKEGKKSNK